MGRATGEQLRRRLSSSLERKRLQEAIQLLRFHAELVWTERSETKAGSPAPRFPKVLGDPVREGDQQPDHKKWVGETCF